MSPSRGTGILFPGRITTFSERSARWFLLLVISIILIPIRLQTGESGDESRTIRIGILSKQLRLVREGVSPALELRLEKGSECLDGAGNPVGDGNVIVFTRNGGRWLAMVGRHRFEAPFNLRVEGAPDGNGVVMVPLKDETRRYPLPLSITGVDGTPLIHVQETIERYAVDSARAEFGPIGADDHEALMALAHVIMARCRYMERRPRHNGHDVCDLTHCQVYRGRTSPVISFEDSWRIDHARLGENLFFHSRCGGATLGEIVFGIKGKQGIRGACGVRDWLYRQGVELCGGKDNYWERSVEAGEVLRIFNMGNAPGEHLGDTIYYDAPSRVVTLRNPPRSESYPVETFRLRINRVKGWNFIRSNNFDLSEFSKGDTRHYLFRGRGLGHGAGLCQHGALELSRRGYNRYEILEHYYGDIHLVPSDPEAQSPYLSYCVFELSTGKYISAKPGQAFLQRRVPPGSIFKLIVAFYLAEAREDIFGSYAYRCQGINRADPDMPERCWYEKGHGTVRLPEALAHSCNLYFASLYNRISEKKFRDFFMHFCESLEIDAKLPETSGRKEWSRMLAGLDFRIDFAVDDYVKIIRFIGSGGVSVRGVRCLAGVSPGEIAILKQALGDTFNSGTASGTLRPYGDFAAHTGIARIEERGGDPPPGMWGKTSTIIDGTNRALGYGLFVGGDATRGVVALLRKGNGHLAARWARAVCRGGAGE